MMRLGKENCGPVSNDQAYFLTPSQVKEPFSFKPKNGTQYMVLDQLQLFYSDNAGIGPGGFSPEKACSKYQGIHYLDFCMDHTGIDF